MSNAALIPLLFVTKWNVLSYLLMGWWPGLNGRDLANCIATLDKRSFSLRTRQTLPIRLKLTESKHFCEPNLGVLKRVVSNWPGFGHFLLL